MKRGNSFRERGLQTERLGVRLDALEALPRAAGAGRIRDELPPPRPRSVVEVMDLAFAILRRRFAACIGVACALWLPLNWMRRLLLVDLTSQNAGDPSIALLVIGGTLIYWAGSILSVAAVAIVAYEAIRHGVVGIRKALLRTLLRLPVHLAIVTITGVTGGVLTVFLTGFGGAMMVGLGPFGICFIPFFVLPAAYLSTRWILAPVIVGVEGRGPFFALVRSWRLTRGGFWRAFGIGFFCVALWTMTLWVEFSMITSLQVSMQGVLPPGARVAVETLASTLMLSPTFALFGSVLAAFYLDGCVRREATDLQMDLEGRVQAVAAGAGS